MKNMVKSKKMWIAFSIVFLSGIVIGIVVGMAFKHPMQKKECEHRSMMKMRLMRHMSNELQLTPDQKVTVDEIITGMTEKISTMHLEQRPKIKNIIEIAFADIDKILTEEQKIKMLKLQKRMSSFRKKHNNRERRERRGDKYGHQRRREGNAPGFRFRPERRRRKSPVLPAEDPEIDR